MRLSGRQQDVIAYLRDKDWTSPTEIGRKVWGYPHHSSTASPVCKRLVARGLLERNARGHYRLRSNMILTNTHDKVPAQRTPGITTEGGMTT